MAVTPIKPITSGYNVSKINDNFQSLQTKIDQVTLSSQDGQNVMYQDFDLNNNDLLNVNILNVQGLTIAGSAVTISNLGALGPNTVSTTQLVNGSVTNDKIVSVSGSKASFQQFGTGAILKDLQTKAREVISVKDFGAVGDGITDDTSAIQAAFTYAGTLSKACMVRFPSGTYLISSGFSLPLNTSVDGDGRGTTRILVNSDNISVFSCTNITSTNAGIVIRNLSILSAKANTIGINFTLANKTLIQGIEFAGCSINISIDRGKIHQISDIISTGYSTNPFGLFKLFSSVDTDYIYNANLQDVIFYNSATGMNTTAAPSAIYVRRGVSCYFHHIAADSMLDNTIGTANFIIVENDSQGCKFSDIIGVYCSIGVTIQQGSGVAVSPYATEFDNVDIDQPTVAAISVISGSATVWNGGMITARGGFQGINAIVLGSGATITSINNAVISGFNSGSNGSAIFFNGCSNIMIRGCMIDSCFNGVVFSSGSNIRIFDSQFTSCINKFAGTPGAVGNWFSQNSGFNPIAVSTPSIPASTGTVLNQTGVRCSINIFGGSVSGITVNGVSTGLTSGTFELAPGDSIQLFYSSAPSWTWIGH